METQLGADLSNVRIHEGHGATLKGAKVYANGNDIHFAPGTYDPYSPSGSQTVAHELTQVVQQRKPGVRLCGISADNSLEQEADSMGARAMRG